VIRSLRGLLDQYGGLLSLGAFFGTKILLGLALLKLSAELLPSSSFTLFSQFLLAWALLNLVASGGVQNGLIRQIASAESAVEARTSFRAGMRIWAAASLILVSLWPLKDRVAVILVGDAAASWILPWLVCAAAIGGLGQLCNAVLIGSGRLTSNVVSQAAGLIAGFIGAVACLYRAEAGWAVVAFAVGSLLTPVVAVLLARKLPALSPGTVASVGSEVRALLSYSGAFVAVALMTPVILFTLRFFYREAFGVDALAEWLVANRISDVSTQLIGLFMVQWYLPKVAGTARGEFQARTVVGTFVVGTAAMLLLLAIFMIGAPVIVPLLLSPQYLSASGLIALYMLGDALRVSASMALHHALARRRLWMYLGIEASSAALLGVLVGWGIQQERIEAPYLGYVGVYGILTTVIATVFLFGLARKRAGASAGPGESGNA